MSFFIEHPDEWIGVPEYFPFPTPSGGTLDSPQQWADQLADELVESDGLDAVERARVIELMLMASQLATADDVRVFVAFEDWRGAAYVVEARTVRRGQLGTQPLESVVGFDDPAQLGPPFVEDFATASGVDGKRGYRYLPYDDQGIVYGRVDYAFEVDGEVLTLTGVELDLLYFEKLKPALVQLASSVRWRDG